MDIAALLESHRNNLLDDLNGRLEGHPNLSPYQIVEICYDRATIKSLLAVLNNGEVKSVGQAALTTPPPATSKRVKAGSKKARERALKAGETRRKNLAARQADAEKRDQESKENPAGQPFVRTGEGGGQ